MMRFYFVFSLSFVIISLINCQASSLTKYALPALITNEIDEISLRIIKFDPARISYSLVLTNGGYGLKRPAPVDNLFYNIAVGKHGFLTGKYYFHFQIKTGDEHVLFSLYDDSSVGAYTNYFYPSYYGTDGISYGGASGYIHYSTQGFAVFGPILARGYVVGMYVNMDELTVTYFVNNNIVGSCKLPTNNVTYYPSVSLASQAEIISLGFK